MHHPSRLNVASKVAAAATLSLIAGQLPSVLGQTVHRADQSTTVSTTHRAPRSTAGSGSTRGMAQNPFVEQLERKISASSDPSSRSSGPQVNPFTVTGPTRVNQFAVPNVPSPEPVETTPIKKQPPITPPADKPAIKPGAVQSNPLADSTSARQGTSVQLPPSAAEQYNLLALGEIGQHLDQTCPASQRSGSGAVGSAVRSIDSPQPGTATARVAEHAAPGSAVSAITLPPASAAPMVRRGTSAIELLPELPPPSDTASESEDANLPSPFKPDPLGRKAMEVEELLALQAAQQAVESPAKSVSPSTGQPSFAERFVGWAKQLGGSTSDPAQPPQHFQPPAAVGPTTNASQDGNQPRTARRVEQTSRSGGMLDRWFSDYH
ncbi:hypothetical protein FYK55_20965 [Roseiconus nitratireducens]|uniref:Uncharacterized protein n=1 Tax=Roseiconus nitratireducens TaxID=2605748 RepID=A0A5M6CZD7_9BACT|nr:hypothetical protein [Roseiconus nitratireducens]KAA5540483.1 hypothetical protein FYK55_20965 [Roseiconus nitratireducens]